ncbi:MAG: histidine kinase dimerization/phosphoacceptor domain -containing protein, partial [Lewinella sp.]
AEAYLLMALIHEQQRDSRHTLKYLEAARKIVEEHGLTEIESELAIRYASYYRLFGSQEEALYFSKLALTNAIIDKDAHDQAVAHLVMSLIYREESPEISFHHLTRAGTVLHDVDDSILSMVISLHLSEVSYEEGEFMEALEYNDEALFYSGPLAGNQRSEAYGYRSRIFDDRAKILGRVGRLDSAYHYLARGRELELAEIGESHNTRVAEIEAQYGDQQKQQLIAEQQAELNRQERAERRVNGFLLVVAVILLVLAINYQRLRGANKLLADQSLDIQDKNDRLEASLAEQQLLRAELHHRIKNNLQIIIGLLDMQVDEVQHYRDREKIESLMNRVHSMAAIHDILYRESSLQKNSLQRYVTGICEQYRQIAGQAEDYVFTVNLPHVSFTPDVLIPLGTIVNELLMNSGKHALVPGRKLKIAITIESFPQGGYCLTYRDNGPGYPPDGPPSRQGSLGMYLLAGLSRQLGGHIKTMNDSGAVTILHFGIIADESLASKGVPLRTNTPSLGT